MDSMVDGNPEKLNYADYRRMGELANKESNLSMENLKNFNGENLKEYNDIHGDGAFYDSETGYAENAMDMSNMSCGVPNSMLQDCRCPAGPDIGELNFCWCFVFV